MAAKNAPPPVSSNDSQFISWVAGGVLLLVCALIIGGFWMQSLRADDHEQRQQAAAYSSYLQNTQPTALPTASKPRTIQTEAQETRAYLLNHPAVTPGPGFDYPGVQSTGKTIVQAIDQAKGF